MWQVLELGELVKKNDLTVVSEVISLKLINNLLMAFDLRAF